MLFCRLLIFFKINYFEKKFQEYHPSILSGLIWVQTVCKGYQQTTLSRQGVEMQKYLYPVFNQISTMGTYHFFEIKKPNFENSVDPDQIASNEAS